MMRVRLCRKMKGTMAKITQEKYQHLRQANTVNDPRSKPGKVRIGSAKTRQVCAGSLRQVLVGTAPLDGSPRG